LNFLILSMHNTQTMSTQNVVQLYPDSTHI